MPLCSVFSTAFSMALASASSPSECRSSIAALRIVPSGFAMPLPAMSGAEPWIGSYRPSVPSPSEALGQQAERAGEHRGLVRQDVAEHVLGDDHVEAAAAR